MSYGPLDASPSLWRLKLSRKFDGKLTSPGDGDMSPVTQSQPSLSGGDHKKKKKRKKKRENDMNLSVGLVKFLAIVPASREIKDGAAR